MPSLDLIKKNYMNWKNLFPQEIQAHQLVIGSIQTIFLIVKFLNLKVNWNVCCFQFLKSRADSLVFQCPGWHSRHRLLQLCKCHLVHLAFHLRHHNSQPSCHQAASNSWWSPLPSRMGCNSFRNATNSKSIGKCTCLVTIPSILIAPCCIITIRQDNNGCRSVWINCLKCAVADNKTQVETKIFFNTFYFQNIIKIFPLYIFFTL